MVKTKKKQGPRTTGLHNADWRKNDALIRAEYTRALKETHRMPTQAKVAEVCGLTEKTVNTHLHAVDFNELIKPFKLFGSNVLQGLAEKAEAGDAAASRLFFFLVFDKVERKEIKAEVNAAVKVKGKIEVKHNLSPKVAKILGDALADEKEEQRLKALSKDNDT